MAADYPWFIGIAPWGAWHSATGHTPTRAVNTSSLTMAILSSGSTITPTIDVSWKVRLGAGTWDLGVLHHKGTVMGIQDWYLDATLLGSIEGYQATIGRNSFTSISGFTVGSTAVYTLKLSIATKNASATDYQYALQHITLRRTA